MIHTLLVPLDGSALAEQALPHAQRIARTTGATMVLIRAVHTRALLRDPMDAELNAIRVAEEYLERTERRLGAAGVAVRSAVVYDTPAAAIVVAAEVEHADLIVMSTHGRSGLSRAVLGSVAEAVLHDTMTPLLLVPAAQDSTVQRDGPYRTVLVPLDRTALAESALRLVAAAPFARGAEYLLVHNEQPLATGAGLVSYVAPVYGLTTPQPEQAPREAHRYLEATAQAYLSGRTWYGFVSIGEPATSIVHIAQDSAVDLIAMATHGRSGLDRLVHGSVAAAVLHQTAVPVLICHGAGAADAETTLNSEKGDAASVWREAGGSGDQATMAASAQRMP